MNWSRKKVEECKDSLDLSSPYALKINFSNSQTVPIYNSHRFLNIKLTDLSTSSIVTNRPVALKLSSRDDKFQSKPRTWHETLEELCV